MGNEREQVAGGLAVVLAADEEPRAGSHALGGRGGSDGGDSLWQEWSELLAKLNPSRLPSLI